MVTVGRLNVTLLTNAQQFIRGMDTAQKRFQRAGRTLQRTGQNISRFVTVPVVGVGAAAVKMASDAAESASKLEAVFGPATDSVNASIARLRDTVPETTAQLQGMHAEIGDLLIPLGLAPDKAQAMTEQVVQLAGDLASFNNIPMAEALERIRSGLVGQNEPLLKFGVALDAATVKQRALEIGLYSGKGALDAGARAQAAFSLILEKTTAAHGDAAKTAESVANQFKFVKAESAELAILIGTQLLPAVQPIVSGLADWFKRMQEVNPELLKKAAAVAAVAAVVGPLAIALGALLAAINPITLALVGGGGLIAGIVALNKASHQQREAMVLVTEATDAYRVSLGALSHAEIEAEFRALTLTQKKQRVTLLKLKQEYSNLDNRVKAGNIGLREAQVRGFELEDQMAALGGELAETTGQVNAAREAMHRSTEAIEGGTDATASYTQASVYAAEVTTSETIPAVDTLGLKLLDLQLAYQGVRGQVEPLASGDMPKLNRSLRVPELKRVTGRLGDFSGAIRLASRDLGGLGGSISNVLTKLTSGGGLSASLAGFAGGIAGSVASAVASKAVSVVKRIFGNAAKEAREEADRLRRLIEIQGIVSGREQEAKSAAGELNRLRNELADAKARARSAEEGSAEAREAFAEVERLQAQVDAQEIELEDKRRQPPILPPIDLPPGYDDDVEDGQSASSRSSPESPTVTVNIATDNLDAEFERESQRTDRITLGVGLGD